MEFSPFMAGVVACAGLGCHAGSCRNASRAGPGVVFTEQMSNALVPSELLDPVVAYFQPRRVILFGSVARGEAGPDSDIDLLVVVDDDTPPERLTIRAGIDSRMSYRYPADVIPCRESTYRRKARIAGTLAYEAAHAGTVIYERP
jgi:hypothetical protein